MYCVRWGVKEFAKLLALVCGSVAALVVAVYGALYALFDGLSTARVAAIVMLGGIMLAAGALATFWLVSRLWGVRQSTPARNNQPVWDATWRPYDLPDYQAPQAQLPARTINVPRYTVNGAAQAWGQAPARQIDLQMTTDTGSVMTVPLDKLQSFLSLETPKRSEWSGDKNVYSQCLAFCAEQGLLVPRGNGYQWHEAYPTIARREWIEQFESQR
jgi:hypothetical protein